MQRALPFFEDAEALRRLGTLYLAASLAAMASFYAALVQTDSAQPPALAAAAGVGLACLLLRLSQKAAPPAAEISVVPPRRVAPLYQEDLLLHLGQLLYQERPGQGGVGLMLVTVQHFDEKYGGSLPDSVANVVRGALFRDADSRVFEVDERSFAVAECRPDAAQHFDRIARELQREFHRRRVSSPDFESMRLTVGVALAGGGPTSPGDLLTNARTATRLAEAHGRESFFRRV